MTCQEIKEHITAAVDRRLDGEIKQSFEAHMVQCPDCRSEFELELLTKKYLRARLVRSRAPSAISGRILSQLNAFADEESSASRMSRLWAFPRLRPALVIGTIALVALVLFLSVPFNTRHRHTSPDDNNILHQSFNNYDAVLDGTLKPQVASSDPAEVKTFFAKSVNYDVKVPHISKCKLIGGLISNYQGKSLAHLVYKHGDEVVYLYQIDMQTVLEGKTLMLPPKVREELLRTGWYTEAPHAKCSLVIWVVDSTLCTAVADMDKSSLIAYLTYPNEEKP